MSLETPSASEGSVSGAAWHTRTCDCPCHRGDDVFHVVSCCGSVLGRRRARESLVAGGAPAQPARGATREPR